MATSKKAATKKKVVAKKAPAAKKPSGLPMPPPRVKAGQTTGKSEEASQ